MVRVHSRLPAPLAGIHRSTDVPAVAGIPADFILFAVVPVTIALTHHRAMRVVVVGLAVIALWKLVFSPSPASQSLRVISPANGCSSPTCLPCWSASRCSARHFDKSRIPLILPRVMPDDWKGGLVLLAMVFVLSSFLDNIVAAMIGDDRRCDGASTSLPRRALLRRLRGVARPRACHRPRGLAGAARDRDRGPAGLERSRCSAGMQTRSVDVGIVRRANRPAWAASRRAPPLRSIEANGAAERTRAPRVKGSRESAACARQDAKTAVPY